MSQTMKQRNNTHPGEVLREEFLMPLAITPYRLAKSIGVQQTRIQQILDGKRAITVDTAIRLGRYFRMTPQFWLNLQQMYDIEVEQNDPVQCAKYDLIQVNETSEPLSLPDLVQQIAVRTIALNLPPDTRDYLREGRSGEMYDE